MYPSYILNRIKQGEDPSMFSTLGCLRPSKISIIDSYGDFRVFPVACGHCLRCQDSLRNEWAARMCLHSLSYKHVYFVTLTYGSYNLNLFDEHPFKHEWLQTFPVLDSVNSFHAPRWTPSLIVKTHFYKFIKRLRLNFPDPISFVFCGEFGSSYGRPHFHCVLYSDSVITKEDILNAWSYQCVKTNNPKIVKPYRGNVDASRVFRFRFGSVDIVDLVANGTLDWNCVCHPDYSLKDRNAVRNFTYVAKYLGKRGDLQGAAYDRLKQVFFSLPLNLEDSRTPSVFDENMQPLRPSDFSPRYFNFNGIIYENITFEDFKKICGICFGSSRQYAIAKQYALSRMSDFKAGNFDLPTFCGRQLPFPRYFSRLLAQQEHPFKITKFTWSGVSFTKGNYEMLRAYFMAFRDDANLFYQLHTSKQAASHCLPRSITKCYQRLEDGSYSESYFQKSVEYLDGIVLNDGFTGCYHYVYSPHTDSFDGFLYDRSKREYVIADVCPREDFCDIILRILDNSISKKPKFDDIYSTQNEIFNSIEFEDVSESYTDSSGSSFDFKYRRSNSSTVNARFIYENIRTIMQNNYKLTHHDVN